MHRVFGPLALAAGALGLWVLIVGPAANPLGGPPRALSQEPGAYTAWAWGLLMGLVLGWLGTKDWAQFPEWLRLQRRRAGLLILGGLFASVLLLL